VSDVVDRLRAVRQKLDAARAEAPTLDAEWRRRRAMVRCGGAEAAEAFKAWSGWRGELDALEEEYTELAMELAEEVCR